MDFALLSAKETLATAIRDFNRTGEVAGLVAFLEGDEPLTTADRRALAEFVSRKMKRPRGRPAEDASLRWYRALTSPTKLAARLADRYVAALRYRKARGRPVPPGKLAEVSAELACRCLERRSGGQLRAQPEQVMDIRRREKSRR